MSDIEICIVCKSKNEIKNCKDCHKFICNDCIKTQKSITFIIKKHNYCIECNNLICCYKKICEKCDINPYHMITENVAVGSYVSNYDNFDIIVNLNYPENNVNIDEIKVSTSNGKLILYIGLGDSETKENEAYLLMKNIIPLLFKYNDNNYKILFHCFSGVSRSAVFAISYLSYTLNISIDQAYIMTKNKRKFIEPNAGFLRALKKFENDKIIL